jgi:hypothetical protein
MLLGRSIVLGTLLLTFLSCGGEVTSPGDVRDSNTGVQPDEGLPNEECQDLGAECGVTLSKDGEPVDCGACSSGICGGSGPNKCGAAPCAEAPTCDALAAQCGYFSDNCGSLLNCGSCDESRSCEQFSSGFKWRCTLPEDGCSAELNGRVPEAEFGAFLEGKWQPCSRHPVGGGFPGEEAGVEFTADGSWHALSWVDGVTERNGSSGTWSVTDDDFMIDSLSTGTPRLSLKPKGVEIGVDPFSPKYVPLED